MKRGNCLTPPFGLSLSKPLTLRHGAFGKLSPLLRANGWRFHASWVAHRAVEQLI